jgi:diamine N-acetyltransferase
MTIAQVSIRKANYADINFLMEIGYQTFHETFAHLNKKEDMEEYLSENFNFNQIKNEISDDQNLFYIAFSGLIQKGYAKLRKSPAPELIKEMRSIEIERLYVLNAFHNQKVGASLMEKCLNFAKENCYETIWLGVWEHNYKAISFYERWGFVTFDSHPFLLGNDLQTDLMMKKDLYSSFSEK